jgi:tetratricopeptide (TPR) repeat protein
VERVAVLLEAVLAEDVGKVLHLHGWRTLPLAFAVALTACAIACGGAARRPEPSEPTRRQVATAEEALRRRDYDGARAAYARAIETAPDGASEAFARRELADMLLLFDERQAAAAELVRITALRPDDPRTWHDLGIVRHSLGEIEGAAAALEKAKALAPDDARPRVALAALLWEHGAKAAAKREYEALLLLDLPPRLREKVEWAIGELSR